MNIPAFFHSDISLSQGSSSPSKWVSELQGAGFERACIVDVHSVSAMVKFLDSARSSNLRPLIGATVNVEIPAIDELVWSIKARPIYTKWCNHYGLLVPSLSGAYKVLLGARDKLAEIKKTKRKGRLDELATYIIQEGLAESGERPFDDDNINFASHEISSWNFDCETSQVVLVSTSREGHSNLLKTISLRAIKEKNDGVPCLSIEDLSKYRDGVQVIDPLAPHGIMYRLMEHAGWGEDNSKQVLSAVGDAIDFYGVTTEANEQCLTHFQENPWTGKLIPLPVFRYLSAEDYDNYCVKFAVQSGNQINDPFFVRPSIKPRMVSASDVESFFERWGESTGIDLAHWAEVEDSKAELGCVKLPNYDMDVREIVEYASDVFYGKKLDLPDTEAAENTLEKWIKSSGKDYASERQQWLNDYCLHKLSKEGLESRLSSMEVELSEAQRSTYQDRFDYEFDVIKSMGFSGYFLIQFDFVKYARQKGVPVGDGRGSAAGSLIVYALEITDVDPIEYGLQFERFLNPERVSMPDIDVDFGDGGEFDRETVLAYIRDKYQDENSEFPSFSQIANINRYQLKSAIAAVRKVHGLSMHYQKGLDDLIKDADKYFGTSNANPLKWSQLLSFEPAQKRLRKDKMMSRIFSAAKYMTGQMSTYGLHAGGVVISPTVVPDYAAISLDAKGNYFSQLDKDDIERAGLIKFDVLGLKTLSVMSEVIVQIKRNRGIDVDVRNIPKDCHETFALLSNQILGGVFQLESSGMSKLVGELQPRSIDDIGVLSALFRPGPLESKMHTNYLDVKYGRQKEKYDHPSLEVVTKDTYGQIIYQEQVMSIVRELAGYSLGQADLLRRAMGKKKIEEMQKQRAVYSLRAQKHWRQHYLDVGESQGFDFPLDICLQDLREELTAIGLSKHLNEEGYICEYDDIVSVMQKLLKMNEHDLKAFNQRVSDINYTVILFKEHYMSGLFDAIQKYGHEHVDGDKLEELSRRLYFAISQYVRFNQVFNKIEKFAGYGFNKSHAIAYSVISYITAYLKTHYGPEFYAATMSFKETDKIEPLVAEAFKTMGIKLERPDVNKSDAKFKAEGMRTVRYGLASLKKMGKSAKWIEEERESGPFLDPLDFYVRIKNKYKKPTTEQVNALCVTGGMDSFIPKRVVRDREINGRSYLEWMMISAASNPWLKNCDSSSPLHRYQDDMDQAEYAAYLCALAGSNWVKKKDGYSFLTEQDPSFSSRTIQVKSSSKITLDLSEVEMKGVTLLLYKRLAESSKMDSFEIAYLSAYGIISSIEKKVPDLSVWNEWLRPILVNELNTPIAKTLSDEKEASGLYMTSNPIRALRIPELVEKEPPSSVMDGAPVPIELVDVNYDQQTLTTYGVVRNLELKRVKNESSAYYGESFLVFELEHGMDRLSCSVFGSYAVKFMEGKLSESSIILAAGTVNMSDYGLKLNLEAFKRYYPEEDEHIFAIPKKKRGK